ncbi:MAG: hypothetical protein LBM04_13480, partial [Opitutaceae bacterium]|nr:hypothetical protein [Opitutaceae bacterium]
MSKTVKFVLITSIAVNAIWLIGAVAGYFAFGPPSRNVTAQTGDGALSPGAAGEVAALLSMEDAAALRDTLRTLGLPDDIVREVVRARIMGRYQARLREIDNAARAVAARRPYWRGSRLPTVLNFYTNEQEKQRRDIEHEAAQQIGHVLGADGEPPGFSQLYHAYLPQEKAERLMEMENDYYQLQNQARQEMAGFRMPGDEAKLKLLDDEKKRDLYAMLTPDEKAAYDLRKSDTASQLQNAFAGFDVTEEEYKAIYALQDVLEEK